MANDGGVHELSEKLRAAEGREAKFRMLAQKAKDAILATDSRGVIEYMNRSAEKLFGYSLEEAVGRAVTDLLPRRPVAQEGSPGTVRVEAIGLRKDGTEFPVDISVSTWQTPEGTFSSTIV